MSKRNKCIHVYVKQSGFDRCEVNLIKQKFKNFADFLSMSFDCDYLSVSYLEEISK